MRHVLIALLLALGLASPAAAQVATPANTVGWDQDAADLATAQAFSYRQYPDGAGTGVVLTGVTCTGTTSPFACKVAFPAFTPGAHALALTATNEAGESLKSTPFAFRFVVIPTPPRNLRSGSH